MNEIDPGQLAKILRMFGRTPFAAKLGLEIVSVGRERVSMRLPFSPDLVGDPETGVVHGGVVTTLLDHTSGLAVLCALRQPMPLATLDLRIDYMKPAMTGEAILAEVSCLKVTREIAFVRGSAYQADRADPLALSTGTFMLMRPAAQTD
jgi:uncharacterized protein (TIGR00369 family)